ncbi:MAG: HD family phosphohydrolase [Syntrophomonadaceae bacterium]
MFTRAADAATSFRRTDAIRLIAVSVVLVIALGAILAIDVIPTGLALKVGDIPQSSIKAPRAISFDSAILTDEAMAEARAAVPPEYDFTAERAATIAAEQAVAYEQAVSAVDAAYDTKLPELTRAELLKAVLPGLSADARATLLSLSADRWKAVRDEGARVLDQIERTELRDTDVTTVKQGLAARMVGLEPAEQQVAAEIVAPLVVPNSAYSEALTVQARETAARQVPPQTVTLQQNEVVVDGGHPVTALDMEEIEALGLNESHLDVARLAGWFVAALLLVALLLAWVQRFRPEFWHRNNVLMFLGLVLLFTAFAIKLTAGRSILPFFLPTAAAGILVAILLDAGVATVVMAIVALLAGAANGNSLELTSYVLLGGLAGIIAVRRGDRFGRFVNAGLAVALVNGLVVTTFALLGQHDVTGLVQLLFASAASAGGSAILAVGTFAVLGSVFGILTVFQLLELANPSQPVLRRLLVETPGTYHHALMVGNLAERAAEAISADPLLARVGAYYHDIGKLANPLAFIENQAGGENVHDELDPEVSAQILKQHVVDGIDIAYRAKLPKPIISFIPQHHGTAIIGYFYGKARELAAAPFGGLATPDGQRAADAVDPRRFRHAGPKPQSKEAALIMLADGVEASVRSLSSRDEAAIRAMVTRIIEERLVDGQFDECDLTLRDIERIREAFVGQLLGMYHQRVAYPESKIVELESRRGSGTGA